MSNVTRLSDVLGSAIIQIIAVNRRNHHMLQTHSPSCFRHTSRLVILKLFWLASCDCTKATRTSTDVAKDHERGGLLRVAFHSVGTLGIVTNGFELEFV